MKIMIKWILTKFEIVYNKQIKMLNHVKKSREKGKKENLKSNPNI